MSKFILLYLCGIYNLAFVVFHIFFWKLFNWKEDLKGNSPANRGIIQVLNTRLIYIFLFMAFLYFVFLEQLLETQIGLALLIGFLLFWVGRTIEQFIFFKSNSKIGIILTIVFFIGIIIH